MAQGVLLKIRVFDLAGSSWYLAVVKSNQDFLNSIFFKFALVKHAKCFDLAVL